MGFSLLLEDIQVRVHCRKYHDYYILQYTSLKTGTKKQVPLKKSGRFRSPDDAFAWAREHIHTIVAAELKLAEREKWRLRSPELVKHYHEYSKWRYREHKRSAKQELSVLKNYVFHYFINIAKLNDPNKWCDRELEYSAWLKTKARTRADKPLALSSGNRAISAVNQFLKWMKRKRFIDHANFRPFESFDQRKMPKRSIDDLVSDEVFASVHQYLKRKSELYADIWLVQRRMGFRINELLGLSFNWLSDECPDFIAEEFTAKGLVVLGSVYLESQPESQYIKRRNGIIERAPLKWRPAIGVEYSRTVPVIGDDVWAVLLKRYNEQYDLWEKRLHGKNVPMESYLLFDGAQAKPYRDLLRDAFASLDLQSPGSHMLRHTLTTEWYSLKISQKVSELVLGNKDEAHETYVHIVGLINAERSKAQHFQRMRKKLEK